ncbi:hypothetical protein [Leuconostoc gelidum]|uniref:Integral membrane protein n=2 Tax=Leuconostoc TaxID=1243 RepID=A0AB35FZP7_LEUGE|nr:hypothetical protein [Leuconostoc gelidum]MBZ6016014.1 hypothetical protein [Leuconostoc gelidum subsp. gelidum]MCT3076469.1 hypothetical protein [Leuconostoc citreum]
MKSFVLTIGSFSILWIYLLIIAILQVLNHNEVFFYITLILILSLIMLIDYNQVKKIVNYTTDIKHNAGLTQFINIKIERKIGLDFIVANIFPLMDLDIFSKISSSVYCNKLILIFILLLIVTYSRNFAFNPYLYILGYRVYKSQDFSSILLLKKKDYGNKSEFQEKLYFEEIENSDIFILKKDD